MRGTHRYTDKHTHTHTHPSTLSFQSRLKIKPKSEDISRDLFINPKWGATQLGYSQKCFVQPASFPKTGGSYGGATIWVGRLLKLPLWDFFLQPGPCAFVYFLRNHHPLLNLYFLRNRHQVCTSGAGENTPVHVRSRQANAATVTETQNVVVVVDLINVGFTEVVPTRDAKGENTAVILFV